MTRLLMGTDPEFMLSDTKTGQLKSAIGVIHGNKDVKVDLGNGARCFPDNVNAELNIVPGNSPESLSDIIYHALHALKKTVYPYQITLRASDSYPKKECEHPDAKVFGCEPEYCAYDLAMVQAPSCETTFRSCGGHIHLGYSEEKYPLLAPEEDNDGADRPFGRVWTVRMMDLFFGIPSLWMDQDPTSAARRRLYGKAGTHRPKDYGVEWRSPGHFWMRSPETVKTAYLLSEWIVNFTAERGYRKFWKDDPTMNVQEACFGYDVSALRSSIDNTNKEVASKFLNEIVKKYLPAELFSQILVHSEPGGNVTEQQKAFYRAWELG